MNCHPYQVPDRSYDFTVVTQNGDYVQKFWVIRADDESNAQLIYRSDKWSKKGCSSTIICHGAAFFSHVQMEFEHHKDWEAEDGEKIIDAYEFWFVTKALEEAVFYQVE